MATRPLDNTRESAWARSPAVRQELVKNETRMNVLVFTLGAVAIAALAWVAKTFSFPVFLASCGLALGGVTVITAGTLLFLTYNAYQKGISENAQLQ
ncbi:MAG: hypothetical protein JSS61_07180 [Verrucomicrobia bacterium]|nr:hypothetical protein [Verrucomicrobiota bacterium]